MAYNFIDCDRDQLFLLPPSMRDWLPKEHLVWFILDAVEELDLSAFLHRYRGDGWGRAAYPPQMMVALLLYAYCTGIRSSRKIEGACQENVAFKVIAGGQVPDHTTISQFRQKFREELSGLLAEVLWPCGRAGLAKVEAAFRELKGELSLGPIYHWTEVRVRAHVAVCFLAFLLEVELERRLKELGVGASFREVLSDLKRVKAVHLEVKGKQYLARTEAYQGFRAARVAVPGRWRA